MKHLREVGDVGGRGGAEKLFTLADGIKSNSLKAMHNKERVAGKSVATLFFEPSTRTRLSFETACNKLGINILTVENGGSTSTVKGESLEDTIRTVAGYCDAIVMRHSDDEAAHRAAKVAGVPVISAGSGKAHHPSQAVLDTYTIREKRGEIDGASIAVVGDLKYGRTIHSLLEILSFYENINVYGLAVGGLKMPEELIERLGSGIKYHACEQFNDIPKDVDVLYYTRIQKERLKDEDGEHAGEISYDDVGLNKKKLSTFGDKTYVMHPLPRNGELDPEIDDDPRAIYFKQAHNGVQTREAILMDILVGD